MVFDIRNGTSRLISYTEIYSYSHLTQDEENTYAIYCYKPSLEDIKNIKNIYGLHDIIELECRNEQICNQDFLLNFKEYYFINLTDFSVRDNIEEHLNIKILVFRSIIVIFSWEPLYCIERAFAEELKFVDCGIVNETVENFKRSILRRKNTISLFRLDSESDNVFGSSEVDMYLYKILEAIVGRLEKVVLRQYDESKQHLLYAMEISHYERVDFMLRLSLAKKHLIMIQNLVEPKFELFCKIKKILGKDSDLKYYMSSLKSHSEILNSRIKSSINFIRISENLYEANVDNALTIISNKLNIAMQHFSAIATCFLPLNLIAALWGMNVVVPGQLESSEYPFGIIIGIVILIGVSFYIYFRLKRWL